MNEKSILILGVGNLLLADEGIGVHIAQRLQKMALPPEVEVVDGGAGGFELIAHCRGRKKIIIVDAVHADAEPGSVFRFKPDAVAMRSRASFSAHQTGLQEFLHFCKTLTPPPEVIIYGVAPQETQRMSTQLSEMLARKLDEIVALIAVEVERAVASEKHAKSA